MASRSWNRVELIGNLTRDPELRFTPNGVAVCTFGLATNRTYVSEGEKKEEVDFHRLVSWNKLAELCNQLLKKGNKVFISGRLQTRSWEGNDGQTRQTTEIVVEDMIILTPKGGGEYPSAGPSEAVNIDELPVVQEKEKLEVGPPATRLSSPKSGGEKVENEVRSEKKVEGVKEESEPKEPKEKEDKEDIDPDSDLPF